MGNSYTHTDSLQNTTCDSSTTLLLCWFMHCTANTTNVSQPISQKVLIFRFTKYCTSPSMSLKQFTVARISFMNLHFISFWSDLQSSTSASKNSHHTPITSRKALLLRIKCKKTPTTSKVQKIVFPIIHSLWQNVNKKISTDHYYLRKLNF